MELNITPGDWHWHDTFGRKDGLGLSALTCGDLKRRSINRLMPLWLMEANVE